MPPTAIRGPGRSRTARQQSSRPALRKRRRLSQSHQAGFRRLSGGLLLQAAHRLRPAGEAQQRPDRAFRLPARRRGRACSPKNATIRRANAAYRLRDIFGKSNFFLEMQDQGLEIEKPRQSRTGAPLARNRHSAGRHQRLPLPHAVPTPTRRKCCCAFRPARP